jgi:DNA-binding transcriptional ArsR family regulator
MSMKPAQDVARICKVLSVETRVRILELLREHPICVGALAARLDVTQGAVSQHLRILRDAGLVEPDRRGYYVHYALNEDAVREWGELVSGFMALGTDTGPCAHKTEVCDV